MSDPNARYSLSLTEEERAELVRVLVQVVGETHMESRRTDNPTFRSELHQEKNVLKSLLAKVQGLGK